MRPHRTLVALLLITAIALITLAIFTGTASPPAVAALGLLAAALVVAAAVALFRTVWEHHRHLKR